MGKDENLLLNINYIVDFDVIDCVHEDVRYAVPGKDQPKVSREFNWYAHKMGMHTLLLKWFCDAMLTLECAAAAVAAATITMQSTGWQIGSSNFCPINKYVCIIEKRDFVFYDIIILVLKHTDYVAARIQSY